jgi:hypothetical protein
MVVIGGLFILEICRNSSNNVRRNRSNSGKRVRNFDKMNNNNNNRRNNNRRNDSRRNGNDKERVYLF